LIFELGALVLIAIAGSAFITGLLHGATGMAGGILMAAILSHLLGIKAAVPVMTVALILSHASRAVMYLRETDWSIARRVLLFGGPMIVVGAIIFGRISATAVEVVFALFLTASIPIKHWARRHEIHTGPKLLAGASVVWGMLAGNVIGPAFFLAPFLLGTGMNRLTFVGTLAVITLVMNAVKLSVFGATDLIDSELFVLGLLIGAITIPGNWVGRVLLRKMRDHDHRTIIDIMTAIVILNFVYLAVT
jgi:uncharacterized membrane protein YfcA